MTVPIRLCRLAYRGAYGALRGYWFVRRPHIQGVKCVFTDGERVLLVRHSYGGDRWDLPGGAVKRGEPPAAAATREMREELGLTVERWEAIGRLRARIDYRHDTVHMFHARLREPQIEMDPCELVATAWFQRDKLPTDMARLAVEVLACLERQMAGFRGPSVG